MIRPALLLVATLVLAAPAAAQTSSPQSAATPAGARLTDGQLASEGGSPQRQTAPAARTPSPEEAALQAAGEAFGARMRVMAGELQAVQARTDLDAAAKATALDAIVARYAPEADALATRVETFMRGQGPQAAEQAAGVGATIRGVPQQVRAGMTARSAPPAANTPAAAAPSAG